MGGVHRPFVGARPQHGWGTPASRGWHRWPRTWEGAGRSRDIVSKGVGGNFIFTHTTPPSCPIYSQFETYTHPIPFPAPCGFARANGPQRVRQGQWAPAAPLVPRGWPAGWLSGQPASYSAGRISMGIHRSTDRVRIAYGSRTDPHAIGTRYVRFVAVENAS